MKVSGQTQLALQMMVILARAAENKALTQRKVFVRQLNINDAYAEQILLKLKQAGLLQTVRGRKGGFRLARAPASITARQIFDVFEGGTDVVDAVVGESGGRDPCRQLWRQIGELVENCLGGVTIAEIRDREKTPAPEYVI